MCLSSDADLVTGVAVSALGIVGLGHVHRRRDLALASIPLVLGVHLLSEVVVWAGLEGKVSEAWWRPAMRIYLVMALGVVPVVVPLAIALMEERVRWKVFGPFLVVGGVVGGALVRSLAVYPPDAHIAGHFISYKITTPYGTVLVASYIVAACVPALLSRFKAVRLFGIANLAVVLLLAGVERAGLISLWCAWAALTTVVIVDRLRGQSGVQRTERSGRSLRTELLYEFVGCLVLFTVGVGAALVARDWGVWRVPVIAAGFGVGRALAVPITRGPVLRVNPAGSLLSWMEGEISSVLLLASVLVQVWTMLLVGVVLSRVTDQPFEHLVEPSSSGLTSLLVVGVASVVWFLVLTHTRRMRQIGLGYGVLLALSLPLGGGSMNTARTVGPMLYLGATHSWWALALPPMVAALIVGAARRRNRSRRRTLGQALPIGVSG